MIFENRINYLSIQVECLYCLIMRVCLKRGNKMNILVTSAGRRVKIIEYFKESLSELNGKVIATDCDMNAPAIHFADNYEIVPRIDDPNYIDRKSTRLNSSHVSISYAVFCLKEKIY